MTNYLITGGAGFIGSNFVKILLENDKNSRIIVLDKLTYAGNLKNIEIEIKEGKIQFVLGDICDEILVEEIFLENEIDIVINFAAESHVDKSIESPRIFVNTNTIGVQNLLEIMKKYWSIGKDEEGYPVYKKNKRFIQVSTDEVYGSLELKEKRGIKLDENMKELLGKESIICYGSDSFEEKSLLNPNSPYSASKTSGDLIALSYFKTYKFPVMITRCSNNYGPYQFPEKLIPLTIQKILTGKEIEIYGDGKNVRDWLYVDDHCKGIIKISKYGKLGEIYNIGGFNEISNIEIVSILIKKVRDIILEKREYIDKYEGIVEKINSNLIVYVRDRLGHDRRYSINSSKIVKELQWKPEMDFENGIRKTILWYLENQNWIESLEEKNDKFKK